MSRFIQQSKENNTSKKPERKIALSQPGSKNVNVEALKASKPLYGQGKL